MVNKIPLKFDYDDTTPSSLAEFTSSDTVAIANGGTGVSSLSNFGTSLSATTVLAASISATTITSPDFVFSSTDSIIAASLSATTVSSTAFTGGTFTGTSVSSTTLTSPAITGASVSATAVSGTTFNGMSYPPPFGYAQLDSDGTAEDATQNLGVGATIASIVSDSDDITWNDTNKNFEVSSAGVYELNSLVVLGVPSTTNVTIQAMKKRGIVTSVENSADSRIHSSIDPTETSIRAVVDCLAGDVLYITTKDDGTTDITAISGSSIMVKRLK